MSLDKETTYLLFIFSVQRSNLVSKELFTNRCPLVAVRFEGNTGIKIICHFFFLCAERKFRGREGSLCQSQGDV